MSSSLQTIPITSEEPVTEADAQAPAAPSDPLIGRTFGNKYQLLKHIGAGGMGTVYLAKQRGLNREVVVKLLKQETQHDNDSIQRFEREAQTLSQLNHPHIVGVYDFGQDGDLSYMVMEYIQGVSLGALMQNQGKLDIDLFMLIARQLLAALREAHRLHIIHRDIKPSNIMLASRPNSQDITVKVLDFGLVKNINEDSDLTGQHKLVGTISYLAPEQILGKEVDQRADVYALGVLFYHMLAGQKPFQGRDLAVLHQHISEQPQPLAQLVSPHANIPASIIDLVHQCLAKSPQDRPKDAGALLEELERRFLFSSTMPASLMATHVTTQLPTLEVVALNDDVTLDRTWFSKQQHHQPMVIQDAIDAFVGELPLLLCDLDAQPGLRVICLERIEALAHILGTRNLERMAQMYRLIAEQGLLDDQQLISAELEDEYTRAFRAILQLNS